MTDQTKAVAALAEAMEPLYTDPVLVYTIQGHARRALQAIQAKPDILREYGIGRLPTRSEWYAAINPNLYYNYYSQEWTNKMFQHLSDAGYISPDPQPPEPTLREQLSGVMRETVDSLPWPTPLDKDMYGMVSDRLIAEFDITPKAAAEAGRSS